MRVLLATPYDLGVPGGVNRQAIGLLEALTARGIEARLIGPGASSGDAGHPRITRIGRVGAWSFNGAVTRTTLDWRVVPALRRVLREFRPDVVHVHEPVAPLPCAALLWLAPRGVRRVGTFHTFSERGRGYLWAWPWCDAVWSRLQMRIAVSEAARDYATRYHGGEFAVIANGIALPLRRRDPNPPPASGPMRALFVGRMDEPRKGFAVLLDALQALDAERPGRMTLTAVGRGAELWRERARALPVSFAGEVDDAELERRYLSADVVIVPSLGGESFGLVPLEAMAHGVPVVASRIAGYTGWMEGAAELVPAGNSRALAVALQRLAESPALWAAWARAGLALAEKHAWSRVADAWIRLYGAAG